MTAVEFVIVNDAWLTRVIIDINIPVKQAVLMTPVMFVKVTTSSLN
jgi:hypothetical protein